MSKKRSVIQLPPKCPNVFRQVCVRHPWISVRLAVLSFLAEELFRDIYYLCYFDGVEIVEMRDISADARLNILIITHLLKDPRFQELRCRVNGHEEKALLAAWETFNRITADLPAEVVEVAVKLRNNTATLEKLGRQESFLRYWANSNIQQGIMVPLYLLQSITYIRRQISLRQREERRLLNYLMQLWYSGGARETVRGISHKAVPGDRKGRENGFMVKNKINDLPQYLARAGWYSDNPKLKRIANLAVEFHNRSIQLPAGQPQNNLDGVCTGGVLELLLQEQWCDFFSANRKKRFYASLVENQLWILNLLPDKNKGRLVICVDCSGSMQGIKEEKAKAVALCLLDRAAVEGRNCTIILFGGRDNLEVVDCPGGQLSREGLLVITQTFFASKTTDFTLALQKAIDLAEGSCSDQIDLLILTDGLGSLTKQTVQLVVEQEQCQRINTGALLIGQEADAGRVGSFAHKIYFEADIGI